MPDKILITMDEYERLKSASRFLEYLLRKEGDNWGGYDYDQEDSLDKSE